MNNNRDYAKYDIVIILGIHEKEAIESKDVKFTI